MEVSQKNQRALQTLARSIRLSQGEFSLILVRCNYATLQERMMQRLQTLCDRLETPPQQWLKLTLDPSVKKLDSAIISNLNQTDRQPNAVMVFGLDSVVAIDRLLQLSNQVRDKFRKNCPFPLVLWMTEKLMQKLIRLAPDLKSWAAISIKFEATADELIQLWQEQEHQLFSTVLAAGSNLEGWAIAKENAIQDLPLLPPLFTVQSTHEQLELAIHDLPTQTSSGRLNDAIAATQNFVMGRYDHALSRLDSALDRYQQCLSFWESRLATNSSSNSSSNSNSDRSHRRDLEKMGVVLLYIGLCYWRQAELDRSNIHLTHWQAARSPLQKSLQIFEMADRSDLVAKFIPLLGEVWRRLQVWDELAVLAQKSLKLHQISGNPVQLAQDYGFLAEVASQKKQWKKSKNLAQQALTTVACSSVPMPQHQTLYLLLLARALTHLGQSLEAINHLQLALSGISPEHEPRLYIEILKELRSLYYAHKEYQQAFLLKKQQRDIEHQYRFRPFIGASQLPPESESISRQSESEHAKTLPRISTLGRQKDLENLLAKIARNDQKMIVMYGESGVGKSSLVDAGLVPALDRKPIGDRLTIPLVLRTYTNWAETLAVRLNLDLPSIPEHHSTTTIISEWILDKLRQNADRNFLTVLMFDQFEEFFLAVKDLDRRQEFYQFLKICLDIPFTKVILALRQDCLHYLLELEVLANLEILNQDLLNKSTRYYLDDFSKTAAKEVINNLTKESHFYLEDRLIATLVNDLANEHDRIRPIELQLLCNQLQDDERHSQKITTLSQYQELGANPKQRLLEYFLYQSINDCGEENQNAAWKVLYQLTDSQGTRPMRTKSGLAALLEEETTKLDLVLEILVQSGLVVLHREIPGDRYQLIHDYLVQQVRQEYDKKFGPKVELKKTKKELEKSNQKLQRSLKGTIVISIFLAIFSFLSAYLWLEANSRKQNLQISAVTASSEALFVSQREFDALIEGLKAWKQLKQVSSSTSETKLRVITALEQAIYKVKERNRIDGHGAEVWSVAWSADGQFLASGGNDDLVKIWHHNGSLYKTIPTDKNSQVRHQDNITFVSFSPLGNQIATASRDRTVKLWDIQTGELVFNLEGHTDTVYSISFNSTGELIATSSNDGTVKLWNVRDGSLLKTLSGHVGAVNWVSFSPTNKWLASVSEDKTLKIWTYEGKLVANLRHKNWLTVVGFTADGRTIVSGDVTGKVQKWDWNDRKKQWNSTPSKEWQAHNGSVYSLNLSSYLEPTTLAERFTKQKVDFLFPLQMFLPPISGDVGATVQKSESECDSEPQAPPKLSTETPQVQQLATAGHDNLVKVWSLDGESIEEFTGHSGRVTTVNFSPNGELLATGSFDKTVRLWSLVDVFRHPSWEAHNDRVTTVSFSPTGQLIASGSRDRTVKLWDRDGNCLKTFSGHGDRITSLSFSPDGNFLASGSWDNTIKLWDVNDGRVIFTLDGHSDRIHSVNFSPDGQTIASASRDRTIKLWHRNGRLLKTLRGHSDRVNSVKFSPDGELIVSGSDDQTVKLWSKEGNLLKTLTNNDAQDSHGSYVTSVTFSPDSQLIASASWDNTVKLWHRNGRFKKTLLQGYSDSVESVSFSPDGNTLASASWDNTVKLWNIQDGTLIKSLHGHTSGVIDVSFSPDGQRIVSGSDDRNLILWNLDLESLIYMACHWVGDYLKYNPNVNPSDTQLCHARN